jgi:putative dimethyl sulfoxide reductase chaperone
MKATRIDQALGRAILYRFLSLGFTFPDRDTLEGLSLGLEAAKVASSMLSPDLGRGVQDVKLALEARDLGRLAEEYTSLFTYSASPDCPLNECAYAARHIFQESQELADLAGFYSAFGLDLYRQRPDELTVELEFAYLLALKESHAREQRQRQRAGVCADAQRAFLRDHLGRWGQNIGRRVAVLGADTVYASLGRLLDRFIEYELEHLEITELALYQETPNVLEPPEEEGCPAGPGEAAYTFIPEEVLSE